MMFLFGTHATSSTIREPLNGLALRRRAVADKVVAGVRDELEVRLELAAASTTSLPGVSSILGPTDAPRSASCAGRFGVAPSPHQRRVVQEARGWRAVDRRPRPRYLD